MPRISVNEATTYHWSLLEDVTAYQAAGLKGIGVWRRKLVDFGEERGIELLLESNLSVTSFSCAGGFTGSDGQTFREAVDDALDAVRLAGEMRAGCLVVVSGSKAGHTSNHARRLLRDALLELGDAAAQHGTQIALQYVHRLPLTQWSLLNSLDVVLETLVICDHPRVGLVFDLFHVWREPDLYRQIPAVVPWIKLAALTDAHLPAESDDDRCLPGQGGLPLAQIIAALESAHYRGAYELQLISESCRESNYESLLAESQASLRRLVPSLFAVAEQSPSHASFLPQP